jgi:hypothetical protein
MEQVCRTTCCDPCDPCGSGRFLGIF